MSQICTDERASQIAAREQSKNDPASLVAARFRRSGYSFLWSISCEYHEGIVTISGTVPTFHLKQVAQELAAHTPGVRQVKNDLHVTSSARRASCSAATS